MNSTQLKPGDVVQLKSGGPLMTVRWVGDKADVSCTWFVGSEVRHADFKVEQLNLADPKTGFPVRTA